MVMAMVTVMVKVMVTIKAIVVCVSAIKMVSPF